MRTPDPVPMKVSSVVVRLSLVVAVLAVLAAGTGIFRDFGSDPTPYVSTRGEEVELYGQGLYRHDSLFRGAGFRGADAAVLLLAVPLLVVSTFYYRRGSLRGGLLLSGALAFMLYNYASMSLMAAYNDLFLVYVAIFSASLFAFVLLLGVFDMAALGARFTERLPRRFIGGFMLVSGLLTATVWLMPLVESLLTGDPPARLDHATTMVTDALDLAIIVPLTFIAAFQLLRGDRRGYIVTIPLLVVLVILGPVIAGQTISQVTAGVDLSPPEIIGPLSGFLVLGAVAVWILARLLRDVGDHAPVALPDDIGAGIVQGADRSGQLIRGDERQIAGHGHL